jgi:RimJ/RimL family protein N-acetyltransferase
VDAAAGEGWLAVGLFAATERGHGVGTETTRLVLEHAFSALGLARVRLRVLAFNARALACYRGVGSGRWGASPRAWTAVRQPRTF